MKFTSTMALLLLLLTLSSAVTFSQTVINYQTWSTSSGCVFSSATDVPATINGTSGNISHQTSIGAPAYDATNKSVNLVSTISDNTNKGTEYKISYNFKANSSYKITVNATVIASSGGPNGLLRLNLTSGSPAVNSSCTGPGAIDASGSGDLKKSQPITNPSFADYVFEWSSLSSPQSNLMVAAIPPAGSVTQTILIRKITIEETTSTPTPSFSITPGTSTIACGNTTPITFTVNNANNTPGITGYTWNLGASANSWQWNGNPAPAIITTGTANTLTLTPACGAGALNVTATIAAGSNTYTASNSATVSVAAPSLSIIGSDQVCSGSSAYSISNLPCGASVSWGINTSSIASLSCTSCPSTTLTKTGQGLVTLTAVVTNACGTTVTLSKPNIQLGIPSVYLGARVGSTSAENGEVILTDHNRAILSLSSNNGYTSSTWTKEPSSYSRFSITPLAFGVIGNFPTNAPAFSSGLVSVSVTHACGTATGSFVFTYEGDGGGLLVASPNPARASLNVAIGSNSGNKATAQKAGAAPVVFYRIEMIDKNGNVKLNKSYAGGTANVTLDVSALKSDIYTLRAYTGKKWVLKQVVVQH